MTERRKLKQRVRERQARTGESYVTALRQVEAQAEERPPRPGAVPVVEMVELTDIAAQLGIKCRTWIFPELAAAIDTTAALARLRDTLIATMRDPVLDVFRGIVLLGEQHPHDAFRGIEGVAGNNRFAEHVRAGVGGVSEAGSMLAMQVAGRDGPTMIVYRVTGAVRIAGLHARAPSLMLSTRVPFTIGPDGTWEVHP